MSGSAPGRREVAYRLFAAEFDDAEFSYSESDEERAPNYVVTPTGARINRLFAVGVLTEVDDVNPEMVRGRVVDPTGAFVTYAGQYQPDALAFLERADPPTFVALTGKARTFEPDDDDVVYSSVRPESVNTVDADTRDRWVVTAADRTLDRIGVMAAAIDADLAGDRLRAALEEAGVDERLADGVALALEYYDTTPAYLGALRDTALDAVRVVAGERDEADRLDLQPGAAGGPDAPTAADLATIDLSGLPTGPVADDGTADDGTDATSPPGDGAAADGPGATADTATGDEHTADSTDDEAAAAAGGTTGEEGGPDLRADDESPADGADDAGEYEAAGMTAAAGTESDAASDTEPAAGDPSDEPADVEPGPGSAEGTDPDAGDPGDAEGEPGDFDPGEFELDDETREAVEEEYGTEFSTADEVESADVETPEPDVDSSGNTVEPDADTDAEPTAAEGEPEGSDDAEGTTPAEDDTAAGTDAADDVDLEDAVMDAMAAVDDGDGADREALVDVVVDEHGADPADVEAAIEDALMSGRCYEPAEGTLKAI